MTQGDGARHIGRITTGRYPCSVCPKTEEPMTSGGVSSCAKATLELQRAYGRNILDFAAVAPHSHGEDQDKQEGSDSIQALLSLSHTHTHLHVW